jgi:hypothetical protein
MVLGVYETWAFLTPTRKQRFDLDLGETAEGHHLKQSFDDLGYGFFFSENPILGTPKKIRVLLDVTVHGFPCIDLSLDYQDVMGTRGADVKTTFFKQRLYPNGTEVGETLQNDPKETVQGGPAQPSLFKGNNTNSSCGSCFGALPDGECCNTCSDVLYAYRLKRWALPRIEDIEQCRHDGTAKSAYQPPQIIHLGDYSSEDYLPKFTRFSDLKSSGSGLEPRISTPFRLNLSAIPLKPFRSLVPGKSNSPFMFNFSSGPGSPLDIFDDLDDDDDFLDFDLDGGRKNKDSSNKNGSQIKWPSCVQRNVIIHGYDIGEALMIDLAKHGAKSGCWNNDCSETDKFACESIEICADMCSKVDACHWWTWGDEDKMKKCWIRTGRHGREKRYGFSSGARGCFPNPNATDNSTANASAAVENASAKAEAGNSTSAVETKDGKAAETTQPRRLMSLEDKPVSGPPRRLMGFEDDWESSYRRPYPLSFGPTAHMPIFGMGYNSRESQLRKEQRGESCRMHGYFDTNKVPGNFHIGTHGTMAPSYLSYFDEPSSTEKNMRHTINHLAFVDVSTNRSLLGEKQPLDGFESPKAFTFQYYITINPATSVETNGNVHEGYQFRAGSFVTNELIGPAVFFRFDIDPIRATYYTEEVRWSTFFTNICAVIGGCIAMSSLLDQLLEAGLAVALSKD